MDLLGRNNPRHRRCLYRILVQAHIVAGSAHRRTGRHWTLLSVGTMRDLHLTIRIIIQELIVPKPALDGRIVTSMGSTIPFSFLPSPLPYY